MENLILEWSSLYDILKFDATQQINSQSFPSTGCCNVAIASSGRDHINFKMKIIVKHKE